MVKKKKKKINLTISARALLFRRGVCAVILGMVVVGQTTHVYRQTEMHTYIHTTGEKNCTERNGMEWDGTQRNRMERMGWNGGAESRSKPTEKGWRSSFCCSLGWVVRVRIIGINRIAGTAASSPSFTSHHPDSQLHE